MEVTAALSAIDQALWDIRGKQLQAPVWQLLGGRVRDKVRALKVLVYGTIDDVANQTVEAANEGYTAVKVLLFQPEHHKMTYGARLKDMVERAHAIRDAVGWDVDLGFELHRNMAPRRGRRTAARTRGCAPVLRRGSRAAGQRALDG